MDKTLKRVVTGKVEFKDGSAYRLVGSKSMIRTATWRVGDKVDVRGPGNEITLKRFAEPFSVKAKRI